MAPLLPALLLPALLLLASCAKPLPKPPAVVPPPPPQAAAERPTLHANWSFQTAADACLASAAAGHARLLVAVRRKQPIRLRMTLPERASGRPVARFHGPAGAWSVPGRPGGAHEIVFTLGRDLDSLSRVLMLLSGGELDLQSPENNLPILNLSASGSGGQRWFGCARGLVI